MKLAKRAVCLAAAVALLSQSVFALSGEAGNDAAADREWDEIIEEFLTEYDIPEKSIVLGYKNTVTGEEHYYNGDTYFAAASLFKVPLNMVYTDRISRGEMTMDDEIGGVPYRYSLESSIVESSNTAAYLLWDNLGNFREYRRTIAPYMGVDPEKADPEFLQDNYFTARQVIYCLNLLQTEQERFSGVLDAMLRAKPDEYFKAHEQSAAVAHKYGYLWMDRRYINDCAVVYTDDPIVIVMSTASLPEAEERLADYCTLMIDYAQRRTQQRLEEEKAAAEATPEPTATPVPAETPAPSGTPVPAPATAAVPEKAEDGALPWAVLAGVAALAAVCAAVYFASRRRTRK